MDNIDVNKCIYCEYYNDGICNQTTLYAPTSKQVALCKDIDCCFIKDLFKQLQLANKTIESQKDLINSGAKTQVKLIVRNYKLNKCLDDIVHILEINKRELDECLFNNIDGEILQKIKEVKMGVNDEI